MFVGHETIGVPYKLLILLRNCPAAIFFRGRRNDAVKILNPKHGIGFFLEHDHVKSGAEATLDLEASEV